MIVKCEKIPVKSEKLSLSDTKVGTYVQDSISLADIYGSYLVTWTTVLFNPSNSLPTSKFTAVDFPDPDLPKRNKAFCVISTFLWTKLNWFLS